MNPLCLHCYVSGVVQGVFFRDATKQKAIELQITGWVKNLPDRRVEVLACGEKAQITALQTWLHQGPPAAEVSDVTSEEVPFESHEKFVVLRD